MREVDSTLIEAWAEWLGPALKRFGSSGYGEAARTLTIDALRGAAASKDVLYSSALDELPSARGLVLVRHARWEESVIGRPVAKVEFFGADSFDVALRLARSALIAAAKSDVVLLSAAPGHSPTFIHAALCEAGFHVGSQALTVSADLNRIAPAVARIPVRGRFREATAADADAVASIGGYGFANARYTSDPFFPSEWGAMLYAAWARNLVLGAADAVVVAEQDERIIGFVSMCMDEDRRRQVPDYMAVEPKYDGFGVGVMLVRHMLDWYRERGMKVMIGGTEKGNTAINALYTRLGFRFLDCNVVYHASPAMEPLREKLFALASPARPSQ
jgi:GNAT superfamily N-acetyltransferase